MIKNALFYLLAALIMGMIGETPLPGEAATITVSVGPAEALSREETEVPIHVAGASGLSSMQMALTYDPAILEVKNVAAGPLLPQDALLAHDAAEPGRLAIGFVALQGLNGDGAVLKARFGVIGKPGQKTALALENVRAWEKSDLETLVHTTPGELVIPRTPWPWWVLAAAIAALVLLLWAGQHFWHGHAAPATARPPGENPVPTLCANPECRNALPPGVRFCPHCGQAVKLS